jgi:two-component system, cell cycle response regulator
MRWKAVESRTKEYVPARVANAPDWTAFVGEGPASRDALPAAASAVEDTATVLVVGNVGVAPEITERLLAEGLAPVVAQTGSDAQRFVRDRIPAAIFLGPSLGDDPYAIVRALRSDERLAFVPVFFFATRKEQGDIGRGIAAGADDVFEHVHDLERARGFADRVVARIARSRTLSQLALLDPLTRLHNRRFMNDRLPAEIARAQRAGVMVSMSLIDLDAFKTINDTFGHVVGDRALVAFADALRAGSRSYDAICRFGGDEFVWLLPACDTTSAGAACAQLRARQAWALPGLPVFTFSAGLAQFPDDGGSWTDLFRVADYNLGEAKRAGRNRTVYRRARTPP